VVEILRPAHRRAGTGDAEMARLIRPGAPAAPFLAQLFGQWQNTSVATVEGAGRYQAAAALTAGPQRLCVAVL